MGIAVANASLNFAKEMSDGATSAATHAGNIDFPGRGPPNTDGPAEVQLFQSLVTTATDGVILENLNPTLVHEAGSRGRRQGRPGRRLDTSPTPGSNVTFYVGNDNYDLGVQMAQELLKELGAAPRVRVVVWVPNPASAGPREPRKGHHGHPQEAGPRHHPSSVPMRPTASRPRTSARGLRRCTRTPTLLPSWGVGDADGYDDLAKLRQEQNGKWLTAGFDVDAKTLQAVKSGQNFMTLDPRALPQGIHRRLVDDRLGRKGHGSCRAGWFVSPGLIVTSANVERSSPARPTPRRHTPGYKPQIDKLLGDVQSNIKPMDQAR